MMMIHKRPCTRSAMMTIRYGNWLFSAVELFMALIVACLLGYLSL